MYLWLTLSFNEEADWTKPRLSRTCRSMTAILEVVSCFRARRKQRRRLRVVEMSSVGPVDTLAT